MSDGPPPPAVAGNRSDGLLSIRAAADLFHMAPSALRHYDAIGLVVPRLRHHGQRMYGRSELRRLALVALARRLGIPLDTVATVLDGEPGVRRRAAVDLIAAQQTTIDRAQSAIALLRSVGSCEHETEAASCPQLVSTLDALVDGMHVDELAHQHRAPRLPTPPALPNRRHRGEAG
jgi:DNA-binding transcriptional MerR regulator